MDSGARLARVSELFLHCLSIIRFLTMKILNFSVERGNSTVRASSAGHDV